MFPFSAYFECRGLYSHSGYGTIVPEPELEEEIESYCWLEEIQEKLELGVAIGSM